MINENCKPKIFDVNLKEEKDINKFADKYENMIKIKLKTKLFYKLCDEINNSYINNNLSEYLIDNCIKMMSN